jgi:uncharacterized SAM-binding protein YcdF (DUF218 family)
MKSERGGIFMKLVVLLFLVLLCTALYVVRHHLLRAFAQAWITTDPIERSDALVVLSDDNFEGQRAAHAAALYKQGMAPVVVASGRRMRRYAGIAELMQHDLEEHGVPKKSIVLFPQGADSTKEEAESLAPFVRQRGWHRVIIVTSQMHVRRARYIFLRVFPTDIDVRIAGAVDEDFDAERWWESRRGIKSMFHETFGMLVSIWELRGKRTEHGLAQFLVGVERLSPQYIV